MILIIEKHWSENDDLFRLLESYNCLKNNWYRYLSINHFINFIDSETRTNNQTIKWMSWKLYIIFIGKKFESNLDYYIYKYLWLKKYSIIVYIILHRNDSVN